MKVLEILIYVYYLEAPALIPLTFGRDVMNQNDVAQVTCLATKGDDPMSISWTFHGAAITSDLDIVTTPIGGRGSNLIIMKVEHKHSGIYTCTASNIVGSVSESLKLQVNGNDS